MEIQKDAFTDEEKAVNFKRGVGLQPRIILP